MVMKYIGVLIWNNEIYFEYICYKIENVIDFNDWNWMKSINCLYFRIKIVYYVCKKKKGIRKIILKINYK